MTAAATATAHIRKKIMNTDSDEWVESASEPLFSSTSMSTSKNETETSDENSSTTEETSDSVSCASGPVLGTSVSIGTPCTEVDTTGTKRKKARWKTICTTMCRYDVVRRVAKELGLTDVGEDRVWLICWMDCSISYGRVTDLKRYQKINHFPGMIEICRKDLLARNFNRMRKLFPKEYNIYPKTWCIPADFSELLASVGRKKKALICKPDTGCQGKGIFIVRSLHDINPCERMVVQEYVPKPFLIDGYKFDLRLYVLVTAVEPEFRIYLYKEGLARFATVKYESPDGDNMENMCMHLTNYAVNKHSDNFIRDDIAGSKRKLTAVEKWWEAHCYDKVEIWKRIDDAIIKTFISASAILKHNYRTCFPNHVGVNACFEILGFDILLDYKLKPYVLEVNLSPSFHIDSDLDKEVKEGLIRNTLQLLDLKRCNPKRCEEEDRKKARCRLLASRSSKSKEQTKIQQQEIAQDGVLSLEIFELQHMNNFRLIYPVHSHTEKYRKFFSYNSSLYQDTVASKAREECAKIFREDIFKKTRYNTEILAAQHKEQTKKPHENRILKKHLPKRVQPRLQAYPQRACLHPQLQTLWSPFEKDNAGNLIGGIPSFVSQGQVQRDSSPNSPDSLNEPYNSLPPITSLSNSSNCFDYWRGRLAKHMSSDDIRLMAPVDDPSNSPRSNTSITGSRPKGSSSSCRRFSVKSNAIPLQVPSEHTRAEIKKMTRLSEISSHVHMTKSHLARIERNFNRLRSLESRAHESVPDLASCDV